MTTLPTSAAGSHQPAGPLKTPPDVDHEEARSMLDDTLDDMNLGAWDVEVRGWVELADPAYVATIATWLRRAARS